MAPFRIPFTSKKPTSNGIAEPVNDENRPLSTVGQKQSLALGIKERNESPNEFKLSMVGNDGTYLPPSPTEKKSFWSKTGSTTSSSNHRSALADNEPFSISRESFDSYRRSFDISGRSPITNTDSFNSRTSFDSRTSAPFSRTPVNKDTYSRPRAPDDADEFEDIKLEDPALKQPKKKSFLSRFSESSNEPNTNGDTKSHFSILPGRRRGQSGTGKELDAVNRPDSKDGKENIVR